MGARPPHNAIFTSVRGDMSMVLWARARRRAKPQAKRAAAQRPTRTDLAPPTRAKRSRYAWGSALRASLAKRARSLPQFEARVNRPSNRLILFD